MLENKKTGGTILFIACALLAVSITFGYMFNVISSTESRLVSVSTQLAQNTADAAIVLEQLANIDTEMQAMLGNIKLLQKDLAAVKAIPPPLTALLPVRNIQQLPQLPSGCEGTSLTILLNYLGYEADKMDITMNYVPRGSINFNTDPNYAYAGNPRGAGWYCYAGAIKIAAEAYLETQNSDAVVSDLTGATKDNLVAQLDKGNPVITWITIDLQVGVRTTRYTTVAGPAFLNLHCVALVGYTDVDFIVCDPMSYSKYTFIDKDHFMKIYESIGSRALIIEA